MAIESPERISLTDRAISFTRHFTNMVRCPHWHQCLEILVIEQGYGTIIVDNQQYTLRPGRVFIFPPFKLHQIIVDDGDIDSYRRTILHLDNVALIDFLRDFPRQRASLQRLCHTSSAATVYDLREFQLGLDQLFTAYQRIFERHPLTLADSACLVLQLLNFFPDRSEISERADDSVSTRVMQWIEDHYVQKFSLAELATALKLSRSYISRTFRQETGGLIHQYLLMRRIRQACEYLRADELPVEAIAQQTGFADTSYFITCFKKMIGDTPLKYRKRHQEHGV